VWALRDSVPDAEAFMPRYVILHHILPPKSARPSHYDLMLERDGVLLTWAVEQLPRAGLQVAATRLPDHRLAYLDYEGPISGDRGHVRRVAAGKCQFRELAADWVIAELSACDGALVAELKQTDGDQWSATFRSADEENQRA
jgi:hypothetical protein